MTSLSSIKDVDKKILQSLDDKDLFEVLLTNNKYLYYLTDDLFWKTRLLNKYPYAVQYKPENQKWKQYYLNVVYYIDKLKTDFNFSFYFSPGDPAFYYKILLQIRKGEFPIGYTMIKKVFKDGYEDLALYMANILHKEYEMTYNDMPLSQWSTIKEEILTE
jgi:hypothetical protein